MRRFHMVRHEDISGVSGTGVVAEGVVFSDGVAILHWLGEMPTTEIHPSAEILERIHGHEGATVLEYLEEDTP